MKIMHIKKVPGYKITLCCLLMFLATWLVFGHQFIHWTRPFVTQLWGK